MWNKITIFDIKFNMYKLIVKNKGVTIIDKNLSQDECESIKTTGAQWFCDVFMKYIGLDISDYTIKEYTNGINYFTISIREEDLIKLREDKLNILID
jgi:hypothetical protein